MPKVITALGGSKLYGDQPWIALRELLQNALDAVRALRALGQLGENEGKVEVRAEQADGDDWWLHVTDTGIGMSRYVLTDVLLDFGNSLWRSDTLRDELLVLPGPASTPWVSSASASIRSLCWDQRCASRPAGSKGQSVTTPIKTLTFEDGLQGRPMLTRAAGSDRLQRYGTRVSIKLSAERLALMFEPMIEYELTTFEPPDPDAVLQRGSELLAALVGWLCPASEVSLYARFADAPSVAVVAPND